MQFCLSVKAFGTAFFFDELGVGPRLSVPCGSIPGSTTTSTTSPEDSPVQGPAKNRLSDYEAGWLTLLLEMKVADRQALIEAQNRVAQQAIDDMNERRERRRAARERRRKRDTE